MSVRVPTRFFSSNPAATIGRSSHTSIVTKRAYPMMSLIPGLRRLPEKSFPVGAISLRRSPMALSNATIGTRRLNFTQKVWAWRSPAISPRLSRTTSNIHPNHGTLSAWKSRSAAANTWACCSASQLLPSQRQSLDRLAPRWKNVAPNSASTNSPPSKTIRTASHS